MKLRRILALLLALTMLLSLGSTALAAKPAVKHITRSRTSYTYYTDEQLREMLGGISQDDLNALKISAYNAVMQNQPWDVYSYRFQHTNETCLNALAQLLYLNPELFFVNGLSYSYYSSGSIAAITPTYDYGYETAMEQHQELVAAAGEILCLFQRDDLSELELALLVHDYLAANYEYHTPTVAQNLQHPIGKYTAYNLLVEGTAVCQGYAEAYAYLMMQFGINCGLCSSDALNHAWNIIELDGKEYHVDVTWDDPSVDRIGYARHVNFLRSTAGMVDSGHTASDFTGNPTNTEYDSAFWQDSKAAFCLFEGTIYYITTSGWLCSWVDGVSTELYKLNQRWVIDEAGRAYADCLSILTTDGESLLLSTPKEILRYFPETNTTEVVYSYSDAEKPYHNIYGFQVRDNNLRILICNTVPSTEEEALANTITYKYRDTAVDRHEYDEGTVITPATCQTEGEMLYSCIYCGAEKTENIGIGDHLWTAATCTEPPVCSLCGEVRMGEEGFQLLASPDELQAGDQIVIAVIVDGAYKAMPLSLSSGKFVPTDLTVENGMVTSAEPPVWTIAPVEGGGYSLYNGSAYLAYNSSTNFKTASTPYAWGMEAGSNGGYIMNSTKATRGIYYQFESAKIGAYSTTNQNGAGYVSELMIFKFGASASGALGHTEVLTPGKAATCTEDGLTDGITCSVCGEVILEQQPIPATGHQEVDLPGKEATCTEDGLTAGKKCSVCETVTLLQNTIPATGHSPKEVAGSDATCTQPGMSAGTVCETCGISLSNQETTPALGHDYKYASNNDGTHTVTCSRGDLEENAECTYLDGFCEFCGYAQPSEEPEGGLKDGRYVIAANVDGVYYAMPNIFASKIDGVKISVTDGKVTEEDAEGYVIELKASDSGWTISDGNGNYLKYNSSTNLASTPSAYVWNITEGINGTWRVASSATPSRGLVYRAGSFNKFGGYSFSNTTSGSTEYYDIELLPVGGEAAPECTHQVTTVIAATEATCVIDGNTEGVICVDCGVILSGADPIPALGHDYSYLSNDNGFHTATCGRCGHAETQECTYEDGACRFCGYSDAFVEKDIYEKATDIAVGDIVVLVYEPKCIELKSISTTSTKYGIGESYETNGYVAPVMPLEVVQGSKEGSFAFKNGSNYLYYNSGNSLDVSTSITDKSSWTVTFDTDGNAIITNVATTNRTIRWNNNSPRFACYTSGQADVQLYKQVSYQPPCAHENTSDIPATDATCTTDGCTAGVQCNDCGEILSGCEPIPAGHSYDDGVQTVAPGCETEGEMTYTCAACGDKKTEVLPATGHSYVDGHCSNCGQTDPRKDYILTPQLEDGAQIIIYNPGNGKALTNAMTGYYVAGKDVVPQDNAIKTDDATIVWTVKVNPDYTFSFINGDCVLGVDVSGNYTNLYLEAGHPNTWSLDYCNPDNCSYYIYSASSQLTPKNDRIYLEWYNGKFTAYDTTTDKLTEKDFGFQFYSAGVVGCSHEWDEGVVTIPETCTENGAMVFTCLLCGEKVTRTIVSPGHRLDEGNVTTPASCTEDGVMTYSCLYCDYTENEPIPATGHNIEYGECTNCDYVVPIARPGRYVIAAKVDGVYYAMANTFSKKISGTPITLTDGVLYADDVKDYVIQLVAMDEGLAICLADGTYLGYPSSGTDLTNPQDAYRWIFTEGEQGTWRVTSSSKEDRALVYSAGAGKFGGYSTTNIKPDGSYYDIELIPVEYDALVTYHSLSLDGNIAIHYYMTLSDRVLKMENAYMRFTFEDNSHVDIPVANAEALTRRGTTTYRFNCEVSAKEMTEVIRAQFFYGDNSTEEDIYSVTTYTDSLLEQLKVSEESIRDNQLLINLLERMLYYGAESQRYFGYNTDRFADEGLAEVNYSAISLSGFDFNRNQGTALVKFAGASLLLKSETTLRLFFTVDPSVAESFSISYNGTALTAAERSGKYYVDVTGIVADRLDEYVTVTVTDGTGAEAAVQYYPLSYCVSVASNAKGIYKEDLIRVVKALYLYNQAANNYFDEV